MFNDRPVMPPKKGMHGVAIAGIAMAATLFFGLPLALIGALAGGDDTGTAAQPVRTHTPTTPSEPSHPQTPAPEPTAAPKPAPKPTAQPQPAPKPKPKPKAPDTDLVEVVDGDTVDIWYGDRAATVRVSGIDTPEIGQCGYAEATQKMENLLGKGKITIQRAGSDNKDHYGRWLRYIVVKPSGGKSFDVGLAMIKSGYAVARYDSYDGYPGHPKEDAYHRADDRTDQAYQCSKPKPKPTPKSKSSKSTDPHFDTCAEAVDHGYGDYRRGVDPEYDWYRDQDNDGVVCER